MNATFIGGATTCLILTPVVLLFGGGTVFGITLPILGEKRDRQAAAASFLALAIVFVLLNFGLHAESGTVAASGQPGSTLGTLTSPPTPGSTTSQATTTPPPSPTTTSATTSSTKPSPTPTPTPTTSSVETPSGPPVGRALADRSIIVSFTTVDIGSGYSVNGIQTSESFWGYCQFLCRNNETAFADLNLGRSYTTLKAHIGVDDTSISSDPVRIEIIADDHVLLDKQYALGQSDDISLSIKGVLRLRIYFAGPLHDVHPVVGDPVAY